MCTRCYDPYRTGNVPGSGAEFDPSPLFRLGQGLSYTTFKITEPAVTPLSGNRTVAAMASCTLQNTGVKYTGTEVVQLYVEDPVMEYVRPWKRLVAFTRVTLAPGESKTVTIPVTADELAFYDDEMVLRVGRRCSIECMCVGCAHVSPTALLTVPSCMA